MKLKFLALILLIHSSVFASSILDFEAMVAIDKKMTVLNDAIAEASIDEVVVLVRELDELVENGFKENVFSGKLYHYFKFPIEYRFYLIGLAKRDEKLSKVHFENAKQHFMNYFSLNHSAYSKGERREMMAYYFGRVEHLHQAWRFHAEEKKEEIIESETYEYDPVTSWFKKIKEKGTNQSGDSIPSKASPPSP